MGPVQLLWLVHKHLLMVHSHLQLPLWRRRHQGRLQHQCLKQILLELVMVVDAPVVNSHSGPARKVWVPLELGALVLPSQVV
jgi:hypothetical protein